MSIVGIDKNWEVGSEWDISAWLCGCIWDIMMVFSVLDILLKSLEESKWLAWTDHRSTVWNIMQLKLHTKALPRQWKQKKSVCTCPSPIINLLIHSSFSSHPCQGGRRAYGHSSIIFFSVSVFSSVVCWWDGTFHLFFDGECYIVIIFLRSFFSFWQLVFPYSFALFFSFFPCTSSCCRVFCFSPPSSSWYFFPFPELSWEEKKGCSVVFMRPSSFQIFQLIS